MILVGSKDIGPLKYILSYTTKLNKEIFYIKTKKNENLLKNLPCIKNWQLINPDIIFAGTCIGNGLDKKLILLAKKKKIKSVAFVEHWSFLKERFLVSKNKSLLPDYIFVTDLFSKKFLISNLKFPQKKIFVIGSEYLNQLKKKKIKIKKKKINKILFISQPHKKLEKKLKKNFKINNFFGFNEFDVIKDLIQIIKENKHYKLTIKKHPNESKYKYKSLLKHNIKICGEKTSIYKIVSKFDLIIGMDSMLLFELKLLGGNVISYRPQARTKFYGDRYKIFPIITYFENLKIVIKDYFFLYRHYNFTSKKKIDFKSKNILEIVKKIMI
jgi:hypothetical protein